MAPGHYLNAIAQKFAEHPLAGEINVEIVSPTKNLHWRYGQPTRQFFIASTTKLYTTAIIFQLIDEQKLGIDDPVIRVLGAETMRGLHIINGKDHAAGITVRHLLSHSSGLADYFEQKQTDGQTLAGPLLENHDRGWNFDDILQWNRERLKPLFAPGTSRKAHYSDTNYQLLGKVVEKVTGESFGKNLSTRILTLLQLKNTYLFTQQTSDHYDSIAVMRSGSKMLHIPKAMASFGCDGGIVSTTSDGITFLKAFLNAKLFSDYWQKEWADWRRIFFPLQYGIGVMRFQLPRIFTLFRKTPEFIGHSGASGAFLFYAPAIDTFFSGTVNQVKKRDLSFRLMIELAMQLS